MYNYCIGSVYLCKRAGGIPVAAQSTTRFPTVSRNEDPFFLAYLNLCLSKLEVIIQKAAQDKKISQQQKDINDQFFFMSLVIEALENFQKQITRNFLINERLQDSELHEKMFEESQHRIEVLNRLFNEYSQNLKIQEMLNLQRDLELKNKLTAERNDLVNRLFQIEFKIRDLENRYGVIDKRVQNNIDVVVDDIFRDQPPSIFEVDGRVITINQEKVKEEINEPLQRLKTGEITFDQLPSEINDAFKRAGIREMEEKGIDDTPESRAKLQETADLGTESFMAGFNRHELADAIKEDLNYRDALAVEIAELNESRNEIQSEIIAFDTQYAENYFIPADQSIGDLIAGPEEDDPFASENENQNDPNDNEGGYNNNDPDDFQPPAGEPDNNNYPNEPPPPYANNQADIVFQPPNDLPEPIAPIDDLQPPSAPPEDAPILNEAPPTYASIDAAPLSNSNQVRPEEKKSHEQEDIKPEVPAEAKPKSSTAAMGALLGKAAGKSVHEVLKNSHNNEIKEELSKSEAAARVSKSPIPEDKKIEEKDHNNILPQRPGRP